MTIYSDMQSVADTLLATDLFGASLTIRGKPTPGDPVTGLGGSDGATRTVTAAIVGVDYRTFPDTIAEIGDKMLVSSDEINVGEVWVDGSDEWHVVQVMEVKPDNATGILWKALVRG